MKSAAERKKELDREFIRRLRNGLISGACIAASYFLVDDTEMGSLLRWVSGLLFMGGFIGLVSLLYEGLLD